MRLDVRMFPDVGTLSRAAAAGLVECVSAVLRNATRFSLALAGGNTPRALYRLLAGEFRDRMPWDRVHLFWGDERYVPHDDPRSNYRLVRETLLDGVPIPAANVHSMLTDLSSPEEAASAYERVLRGYFSSPWPRFDLALLGLGEDGHTASLFPGSPAVEERKRWVLAVRGPAKPPLRLTLTLPVLTHAANVYFLVAGQAKAGALKQALTGPPDPKSCPASGVRLSPGAVVWWTEETAGAFLDDPLHSD